LSVSELEVHKQALEEAFVLLSLEDQVNPEDLVKFVGGKNRLYKGSQIFERFFAFCPNVGHAIASKNIPLLIELVHETVGINNHDVSFELVFEVAAEEVIQIFAHVKDESLFCF